MATANLKNIYGAGGSSVQFKAGQSYLAGIGVGGVQTASLNVSALTDVISLSGRWIVPYIFVSCANPSTGTMTCTIEIDGVPIINSASVGTSQNTYIWGSIADNAASPTNTNAQPQIVCNTSLVVRLQRSTVDTVQVRYLALAID